MSGNRLLHFCSSKSANPRSLLRFEAMVKCTFYVSGICKYGQACKNEHENASASSYVASGKRSSGPTQPAQSIACRYFPLGRCRNAQNCPYIHLGAESVVGGLATQHEKLSVGGGTSDTRSQVPCRFFANGRCSNSSCPFMHAEKTSLKAEANEKTDEIDEVSIYIS
jgi:hypothetical protein